MGRGGGRHLRGDVAARGRTRHSYTATTFSGRAREYAGGGPPEVQRELFMPEASFEELVAAR